MSLLISFQYKDGCRLFTCIALHLTNLRYKQISQDCQKKFNLLPRFSKALQIASLDKNAAKMATASRLFTLLVLLYRLLIFLFACLAFTASLTRNLLKIDSVINGTRYRRNRRNRSITQFTLEPA